MKRGNEREAILPDAQGLQTKVDGFTGALNSCISGCDTQGCDKWLIFDELELAMCWVRRLFSRVIKKKKLLTL